MQGMSGNLFFLFGRIRPLGGGEHPLLWVIVRFKFLLFFMEICTFVGLFSGGLCFTFVQFWFCARPSLLDALFCLNYTAAPQRRFARPCWGENSPTKEKPRKPP